MTAEEIEAFKGLADSPAFAIAYPYHYAIANAIAWKCDHEQFVQGLIDSADVIFAPSREDILRPELWKAGSWKWLQTEIIDTMEKT